MVDAELIALEEEGWRALSDGPGAATAFYERVLDEEVVMLLPGGLRLDDRATVIASLAGPPPWAAYDLESPRVLPLGEDAAVVTYGVVARRGGAAPYSALMSSVYVRRGGRWRLALHQQTPR
ncbi:nuclear transport factor 2 family protein [Geodermatophilus sp. SYSU D00779]